jgi:ketosteroid isomerase-like protein
MNNGQKNIELVKKGYNAFLIGDKDTLLNLFEDNIEWKVPHIEALPFMRSRKGKENVLKFFGEIMQYETVEKFEPQNFYADGETVIIKGVYGGTVTATGISYETEWVHFFTFRNGKVEKFEEVVNSHVLKDAFIPADKAVSV